MPPHTIDAIRYLPKVVLSHGLLVGIEGAVVGTGSVQITSTYSIHTVSDRAWLISNCVLMVGHLFQNLR